MKKCPFCAEFIQDEARICRYCGRNLPKKVSAVRKKSRQRKDVPFYNRPACVLGLLIFIPLLLVGIILFITCSLGYCGNGSATENVSPTLAKMMWDDSVKDELVAPSTAILPSVREADIWTIGKESGEYENAFRVESYVVSHNSFGAMIRTYYICDINFVGDNQYRILKLDYR